MSWLFSQALVEEYLGDISLDGEPSVPLSGSNTQQAYCAPDKMTKFSRLSRFGMTYKPLTESLGEELLTLYLADFHAKTSAQLVQEQESPESDQECGNTWQGSLARLDPNTSLWRTAQCSLLEDLELSLQTFPKWGLMQNGALYLLPTLVQTISVKESGSEQKQMWLTPRVVEVDETPENFRRRMNSKRPNDRKDGFGSLTMQVKAMHKWPTPTASDGTSGAVIGKNDTFYTTSTGMPRKVNQNGKDGSVGLGRLVQMWPTPMSSEHKANRQTRENHQNGLTQAVLATETGGQLNPTWVEWLMGWPLGWTDLKPLEMDKSLYVQQQLGNY
jgi:hypothetical protein